MTTQNLKFGELSPMKVEEVKLDRNLKPGGSPARRPYSSPKLTRYGDVKSLVQSGTGSGTETTSPSISLATTNKHRA